MKLKTSWRRLLLVIIGLGLSSTVITSCRTHKTKYGIPVANWESIEQPVKIESKQNV